MTPLHASEATCYLRCPREHHYAYGLRRVPLVKPEALSRGSAVHRWLERWWKYGGRCEDSDYEMPTDPIARACCLGYEARYDRPHLQDVEVELPFTATIGGVKCAGTVDALGWFEKPGDGGSRMVIVESKTTGQDIGPGASFWLERQTSIQVKMYLRAFPGATILLDAIRKPSLRKLRAGKPNEETDDELVARCLEAMAHEPDKYFQRQVLVALDHEHEAFAQDIQAIDAMRRMPLQPRNVGSCFSFGRKCGYFSVCHEGHSIEDDFVFTHNTHGEEIEQDAGQG